MERFLADYLIRANKLSPTMWTAFGWDQWRQCAYEGEEEYDHPGFWHVTTGFSGVLRDRRLLSRAQLKGTAPPGLGGTDTATVSVTTRPYNALRIHRAVVIAALAAQNRISAAQTFSEILETSGWDELLDEANHYEMDVGALEYSMAQLESSAAVSSNFPTGEAKYHLIQEVEGLVTDLQKYLEEGHVDDTPPYTGPVKLIEPWHTWRRINPRDVRILRLAIRRDAEAVDIVPNEQELQFIPADVRVIAVETITGRHIWRDLVQASRKQLQGRRA